MPSGEASQHFGVSGYGGAGTVAVVETKVSSTVDDQISRRTNGRHRALAFSEVLLMPNRAAHVTIKPDVTEFAWTCRDPSPPRVTCRKRAVLLGMGAPPLCRTLNGGA